MTRTIRDIDFEIRREKGKRDAHLVRGTPGSMFLANNHQEKIDSLLEEKKNIDTK